MEAKDRIGRYIKKSDRIMDTIHVTDFSFEEICQKHMLSFDNQKQSIVHTKYHPDEDIQGAVRPPERFNDSLVENNQKRPVLHPLDFTRDWENEKRRRKQRASRDAEDEFDYDSELYSEGTAKQPQEKAADSPKVGPEAGADNPEDQIPDALTQDEREVSVDEGMRIVGEAINDLSTGPNPEPSSEQAIKFSQDPADGSAPAPEATEGETAEHRPTAPPSPEPGPEPKPQEDGSFIPVEQQSTGTPDQAPYDPEQSAMDTYKARQAIGEDELAAIRNQAQEQGYIEGYRQGEEKGEMQARAQLSQMVDKIESAMSSMGNLKQKLLESAQENFYELAQAVAEALLKRELNLKPEKFADFIRSVIRESIGDDDYTIKVHPKTLDRLQALELPDIAQRMVADDQVVEGDFKVEAKMSVVDINIGKIIGDMLEQADLDLFTDENDSDNKAS